MGCILLTDEARSGELWFDHGRVVAASCGPERGRGALAAIALVLWQGRFSFAEGPAPEQHDLELARAELEDQLVELESERAELRLTNIGPTAVPGPTTSSEPLSGVATLTVDAITVR